MDFLTEMLKDHKFALAFTQEEFATQCTELICYELDKQNTQMEVLAERLEWNPKKLKKILRGKNIRIKTLAKIFFALGLELKLTTKEN